MEKMLAAVFEEEGKLSLREVSLPEIQKDSDVLIEVEAAGVCGTDLRILEVPPGHPATTGVILGHEYTGKIVDMGKKVRCFKVGDKVVVNPNISCDGCSWCRMGFPNLCENLTTLGIFIDGGFARYSVVPAKSVYPVSLDVPSEEAAFAEPLSCVISALEKINFQVGESVVILGAGPIGLLFTQLFRAAGAGEIIVSEISDYRVKFAEESGATLAVNPQKDELEKMVKERTKVGADVVVDAVGSLFKQALTLVRPGGKVLLFGQDYKAKDEITQNDITRNEVTVVGSYIARYTFPQTVRVIESGNLALNKLITHRLSLEALPQGLEALKKGEAIKVIIKP